MNAIRKPFHHRYRPNTLNLFHTLKRVRINQFRRTTETNINNVIWRATIIARTYPNVPAAMSLPSVPWGETSTQWTPLLQSNRPRQVKCSFLFWVFLQRWIWTETKQNETHWWFNFWEKTNETHWWFKWSDCMDSHSCLESDTFEQNMPKEP